MAKLDWPPVWTFVGLMIAWFAGKVLPWGILGQAGLYLGSGLVVAGLAIMAIAVAQMLRARTTVIPRQNPQRLVTGGIFAYTRNPIYLGDAVVLAGACLWWQVPWLLPMVWVFMRVIETRFIRDEEARLDAGFGDEFRRWAKRTRRWFGRSVA